MDIKLKTEELTLATKPRIVEPPNEPLANFLRNARPMRALLVVPKGGRKFEVQECAAPDLQSLDAVIDQGFDPNGPCGPTYWRRTASHYYSTMLTEKGVVLAITELTRSPR